MSFPIKYRILDNPWFKKIIREPALRVRHFYHEPASYRFSVWFFTKCIAFIYLIAFLSIEPQIRGLMGADGILPASEYLRLVRETYGFKAFLLNPTVFWINSGNFMLGLACLTGMIAAIAGIAGLWPGLSMLVCWFLYLSIVNVGQQFMLFQWDSLLLESGLLCVFLLPWKNQAAHNWNYRNHEPSRLIRWLVYWLIFRVIYFSGILKLRGGDPLWCNFKALDYFFESQPLPTWYAWFFHHLPHWVHALMQMAVLSIEIGAGILVLGNSQFRKAAGWVLIVYQVLLMLVGNFGFLNLLVMALCALLFEDKDYPEKVVQFFNKNLSASSEVVCGQKARWMRICFAVIALTATAEQIPAIFMSQDGPMDFLGVKSLVRPLRSFNQYALFASLTQSRYEIILEGSNNRMLWKPYPFKYKPDHRLNRAPGFVSPHQPRLEWQLWLASTGNFTDHPWTMRFCEKVMRGSRDVLSLLRDNPYREEPPKYLRLMSYEYHFAGVGAKLRSGDWWVRSDGVAFTPIIVRKK